MTATPSSASKNPLSSKEASEDVEKKLSQYQDKQSLPSGHILKDIYFFERAMFTNIVELMGASMPGEAISDNHGIVDLNDKNWDGIITDEADREFVKNYCKTISINEAMRKFVYESPKPLQKLGTKKKKVGFGRKDGRKAPGSNPDLLFFKNNMELGCSEFALEVEGEEGTKETRERRLRCPVMTHYQFDALVERREDIKEDIAVQGYIFSGYCLTIIFLDKPFKNVCRRYGGVPQQLSMCFQFSRAGLQEDRTDEVHEKDCRSLANLWREYFV